MDPGGGCVTHPCPYTVPDTEIAVPVDAPAGGIILPTGVNTGVLGAAITGVVGVAEVNTGLECGQYEAREKPVPSQILVVLQPPVASTVFFNKHTRHSIWQCSRERVAWLVWLILGGRRPIPLPLRYTYIYLIFGLVQRIIVWEGESI